MPLLVPTAYFPPVGYMAGVIQSDKVVIEAFETYTKQTSRNHCEIFGPNGKQVLSIPVIKANGNHTLTKDIMISKDHAWQKIHWRSIETAYNNSPFFLFYQDHFARFFEKEFRFLLDLNTDIFQTVLQVLKISIPVTLTQKYDKSPQDLNDRRGILGAKHPGTGTNWPRYTQVFESRHGFIPGLSILDLIFNLGPEAALYLRSAQ